LQLTEFQTRKKQGFNPSLVTIKDSTLICWVFFVLQLDVWGEKFILSVVAGSLRHVLSEVEVPVTRKHTAFIIYYPSPFSSIS